MLGFRSHVVAALVWGTATLSGCSLLVDTDVTRLGQKPSPGDPTESCAACDDKIPCTMDVCEADGSCRHVPLAETCDDGLDCTEDVCDTVRGCVSTARHDRCEYCRPGSRCDVEGGTKETGGCVGGGNSFRNCTDDDPCTKNFCSGAQLMCVVEPYDEDGDGIPAAIVNGITCGGEDCDDTRAEVFPGAMELCNGRDDDCNGVVDDGCGPGPDSCSSVGSIVLNSQGTYVIEGSFKDVGSDFDVACGTGSTRDAVYKLVIEQDGPVDVILSTAADSVDVVLAVGKTCSAEGLRLGCAKPMRTGMTRLALHRFDPMAHGKELFIVVDAKDRAEQGRYRVNVKVSPAAPDVCVTTVFDHTACGTVVGFLAGGVGRVSGSCQSFGGALASEAMLLVAAQPPGGRLQLNVRSDDFSPSLYALSGCGVFDGELACHNPPGEGSQGILTLNLQADQTAIAVVDSGGTTPGQAYTLTCGD